MIKKSSAMIISNNKLLVVKKKNNTSHYILPGGKIEGEETPIEALHRELKEELDVEVCSSNLVASFSEKAQFEDNIMEMYLFEVVINKEPKVSKEILELEWIDLSTNRKDLATGIIKHALPYLKNRGMKNE